MTHIYIYIIIYIIYICVCISCGIQLLGNKANCNIWLQGDLPVTTRPAAASMVAWGHFSGYEASCTICCEPAWPGGKAALGW